MRSCILFLILLHLSLSGLPQESKCRVMVQALAGSYSGQCRKGLAHGRGIATGIDRYKGHFASGFPEGIGTYTWSDGKVYSGHWKKGMKDGKGRMIYPFAEGDSVLNGYWKNDKYLGLTETAPYTVRFSQGIMRYTFRKVADKGNSVVTKIFLGGALNTEIEGFSVACDSGNEYSVGTITGIQDVRFPVSLVIKYRTWNRLHTSKYDTSFEFMITDPGRWEIMIYNF